MKHPDRQYVTSGPAEMRIEAMQVAGSNERAVCDWVNGRPEAWREGYDGNAYPDMGGIEIPVVCNGQQSHTYVRWGDWVVKFDGRFYRMSRMARVQ